MNHYQKYQPRGDGFCVLVSILLIFLNAWQAFGETLYCGVIATHSSIFASLLLKIHVYDITFSLKSAEVPAKSLFHF